MTTEAGTTTKSAGETTSGDFEPEQKRYLEGFVAGLQIAKTAKGIAASAADASPASKEAIGPDAAARNRQQQSQRDRKRRIRRLVKNTLVFDVKRSTADVWVLGPLAEDLEKNTLVSSKLLILQCHGGLPPAAAAS